MIEWTTEQTELRAALAPWAAAINTGYPAKDESTEFAWDKWKLIQRSGVLGLPIAEEHGGVGLDLLTTMYVLEGLGLYCRDAGLVFSAITSMASTGIPLSRFGSAELRDRWLPRICSGEAIGAHAITESESGSDALRMRTTARRTNDYFVLNGSKTFVSNGPIADVIVVYARTHPDGGPLGTTAFLVDRHCPGLRIGRPVRKMGLNTSPLGELYFDDCRIPATNVLGRIGGGFLVLDYVMKREILYSFITNVGEMQHRLERCVAQAKNRVQFGKPIGAYQSVANKIVDMRIRLDTARKWLYDTAELVHVGNAATMELAIAKLVTSEANLASSVAAVQIFGGSGYLSETGLEMDVRNAVAGTIYSGTNEIQYNRIASALGL